MEFVLKRSLNDYKEIVIDSLQITSKAIENTLQYGILNTLAKVSTNSDMKKYR